MTPECLELVKALAGPAATVVAAFAAVCVTYIFNMRQLEVSRQQARIAEAQKDIAKGQYEIAYDKLKHELFDKRYGIYTAARDLIDLVMRDPGAAYSNPEVRTLRLHVDEARFFFGQRTREICEQIDKRVEDVLTFASVKDTNFEYYIKEGLPDKATEAKMALVRLYGNLAKSFEEDLSFEQMRKPTFGKDA